MATTKITLMEIYSLYPFDTSKVAEQAGVASSVVHNLVVGEGIVSKHEVEKVLAAISQHTGRNYTLDTVRIISKVMRNTKRKTEQARLAVALDDITRAGLDVLLEYRPEERQEQAIRILKAETTIRHILHIPYPNPLTPEEEAELAKFAPDPSSDSKDVQKQEEQ